MYPSCLNKMNGYGLQLHQYQSILLNYNRAEGI